LAKEKPSLLEMRVREGRTLCWEEESMRAPSDAGLMISV
jgi:hypothetical protein